MKEVQWNKFHFYSNQLLKTNSSIMNNTIINKKKVKEILSILTPRQKEIIYYRFIQEMSMEDICILMDINYQSAQNLIQRSLKKIKQNHSSFGLYLLLLYLSMKYQ